MINTKISHQLNSAKTSDHNMNEIQHTSKLNDNFGNDKNSKNNDNQVIINHDNHNGDDVNHSNKTDNKNGDLKKYLMEIHDFISDAKDQGAKEYQEDSHFSFCSTDRRLLVAAIFDGHGGLNGQIASDQAAHLSRQFFQTNEEKCLQWNDEQWKHEMTSFFDFLHKEVRENFIEAEKKSRQNCQLSLSNICDEKGVVRKTTGTPVHGGTTATIVCIIRTEKYWRIITTNVGDSDALLLARKPECFKQDNSKHRHLSVDHSPDSITEYLRIKQLSKIEYPLKLLFIYDQNNVTRKYECPLVFLEDGTKDPKYIKNPWGNDLRPINVRYDPAVYAVSPYGVQHDITCIAMTRSIGDFYGHPFGLTHVPDVTFHELEIENNEYIVTVASDGVWDCWKWDDWSDHINATITKNNNCLDNVAKAVLQQTMERAKSCFGEDSYDDASLIIISLCPELFASHNNNDYDEKIENSNDNTGDTYSNNNKIDGENNNNHNNEHK